MLKDIVHQHLIAAGIYTPDQNLGEPFNPLDHTLLVPYTRDGETWVKAEDVEPREHPMTREQRFDLFKKAKGDYLLKMLSQDTLNPNILPYLVEDGYQFITIERRNHFDALLSWLIAWNHHKWNLQGDEERPDYQPFVASMDDVAVICSFMMRYFHFKKFLFARQVVYEDMCAMTSEQLLRYVGLYQDDVDAPPTRWRKLHGFEEKVRFITNIGEVAEYYRTTVEATATLDL